MENKVLLYDADNVKIGETFMRRAKQLVKQQRAVWTDDSQSAVRFAPDMEESWEAAIVLEKEERHGDSDKLTALAVMRIRERRFFLAHSVAFIPVSFFILVAAFSIRSDEFLAFALAAWMIAYSIHAIKYAITYPPNNIDGHKAKKLIEEVEALKSELKR